MKNRSVTFFIRNILLICSIIILLIEISCIEKMALPSEINVPVGISAGDTTYLRINPIWDESYGLQNPIEISIAPDGHIFIADSNNILVFDQSGNRVNGFDKLTNLTDGNGNDLIPIDVDVDEKMNIFFINGSRYVYRWNQLWSDMGIDSVAISATFTNTSVESTVTTGSRSWILMANSVEWKLLPDKINWTTNSELIDSLLSPHIFFDAGKSLNNDTLDIYYNSLFSTFSGISTSNDDNFIYVTDIYYNRIVQIYLLRSHLIKLGNGNDAWTHYGIFLQTVVDSGSGAGTVDIPVAIDVDFSGDIYYAQFGDYFSIHKIKPTTSGDYVTYPSVFQQGQDDIMDLWRFSFPHDVAVDQKKSVYVANTLAQEIQVFNSDGSFFKKAGVSTTIVDTTLIISTGTDTVEVDTFLTVEIPGILELPQAVAVDKRGVIYVCDTPASRIVRYKLSNTLDEEIIE